MCDKILNKSAFFYESSASYFPLFSRCDRAGLAGTIRLAAVRCPAGLAFDINRQTCDWKAKVENCDRLSSEFIIISFLDWISIYHSV